MDKFRIRIRNRVIFLIILFFSLIAIYLVLFLNQDSLPKSSSEIMSFQAGVLSSFSILLFLDIIKYLRTMKDKGELKKLFIKENDERTIMIMQKTGAVGINICIIGFACATIIAGYFNEVIFFTLLGATLFVSLIKGLFKVYYHKNL
ncbi:MAG TPA: hypothetical protein DC034_08765 [Clostridium sp.]|jgi:uncharacterized membrane protein|nr:hypothetical protein [Clostridium sp.]